MFNPNCTFDEVPARASIVCNGHGDCVNGTCICHSGYTGSSDVYNLRGTSCHINKAVTKAFAGISLLLVLQATILCSKAAVVQWDSFCNRGKKRSLKEMAQHSPLQIFFWIGLSIPCSWIYYIRELAYDDISLGDDPLQTFAFFGFVVFYFYGNTLVTYSAFQGLFKGMNMGKMKGEVINGVIRKYRVGVFFSLSLYTIGKINLFVLLAFPNTNVYPWDSSLPAILVLNNLAVLAQLMLSQFWSFRLIKILRKFKEDMASNNSKNVSAKQAQLERTMDALKKGSDKGMVTSFITALIYGPVIAPPLWGYQDYAYMVGTMMAVQATISTGKVYNRKKVASESRATAVRSTAPTSVGGGGSGGSSIVVSSAAT